MQHAEVGHDNFVRVPIDSSKESSKCLHASQESQGRGGEGTKVYSEIAKEQKYPINNKSERNWSEG